MNKFIPIVIEPYPDELLYSWIIRLAKVNELSTRMFLETYLDASRLSKRTLKIDIRREYQKFYNSLNIDEDMMDLYFRTSTTQFELSFSHKRQQIKVFHNILRKEDDFNYISNYFFSEPKVCLECIREDINRYGESYIHRSHQLSAVVACHKHQTPLYNLNRHIEDKFDYDFENITNKVSDITDFDCKYADYTHQLLINNISSNSEDILSIVSNEIKEKMGKDNLHGQPLILFVANMINNNKKEILKRKETLTTKEFITTLMLLFPNVDDFISKLPHYDMVIKKHCDKCNNDYYISNQAIKDGWGCTYCDESMDKTKLLKRLIKNIGEDEFEFRTTTITKRKRLVLYHKTTNRELTTNFSKFLYGNSKHYCTLSITRKEAEKRIKKHKHFKLIEYAGVSKPAKIYHDVCGQTFEVSQFDIFTNRPTCRCCETQHFDLEKFKQQVKDLVGDEYEILGYQREDVSSTVIATIKHNKCGTIKTYKAWNFLTGERCTKCRSLIRKEYLEEMLKKYSDDRYVVIGDITNQKVKILDTQINQEFMLKSQHVVQEMLRPTPSPIFEFNNKERKQISSWDAWCQLCKEYREEFGYLCPKRGEWYKGKLISRWCEDQRKLYNKGQLSEDKILQLQKLDFVFDVVFYRWNKKFEEYKEFVKDTGFLFPQESTIYNGNKVGRWVFSQRHEKTRGRLNPIYETLLLEFNPEFFKDLR